MERILSLPSELALEILSRLPADSVIQCRQVCTTWRDLLCHPSFDHLHFQRLSQINGNGFPSLSSCTAANVAIGLLFSFTSPLERGNQLYYGEYVNNPNYKLKRINQPPTVSKSVIGSCNGLICFSENNHFGVHEPSYICNPITREYVNFPRLNVKSSIDDYLEVMVCGFGYHPSTNIYKIVKIYYIQNQPLGQVKVYTLGSGSGWRDMGETAYSLRPAIGACRRRGLPSYRSPFGTLANGALHWLDRDKEIVSFDLANENLYLLPSPPLDRATSKLGCFQLQVLGGCLCFVHERLGESLLDIWFLRKKGESSSFVVNEQDEYDSLIWIKEFSIPIGRGAEAAEPCALTDSGEVLLHHQSSLFCYNPQTAALERLIGNEFRQVFPHMNSFVSLKALGERCKLRKRYDVNPVPNQMFIKQQTEGNVEIDA